MPFEFFNPSDLAFGKKLRSVFHQLEQLSRSAEENVEQYTLAQEYLDDYDRRNYKVARPIEPFNPCRVDEFFNIVNDKKCVIHHIMYDIYDRKVKVDLSIFNDANNRITRVTGETELKAGFCYYKQASNNMYYQRAPIFSEKPLNGYKLLFTFRVGINNNVIIGGNNINQLGLTPYDSSHYSKVQEDEEVASFNEPYIAKDYECLCVIGSQNELRVRFNGAIISQGQGSKNKKYCILYLKPGEQISGDYDRIFRIRYYTDTNAPKRYRTIIWDQNNLNVLDEHQIYSSTVSSIQSSSEERPLYDHFGSQNLSIGVPPSLNIGAYYIRKANFARTTFGNNEVYLGGVIFRPQAGKGLYEGEPGELYRLSFDVWSRLYTNLQDFSMFDPIGDTYIKLVVEMHNSNNDIIDSWTSAYRKNQVDWVAGSSYITSYNIKETAPDNTRKPRIHTYNGFFERKLPQGGYLKFKFYGSKMSAKMYNYGRYEDITSRVYHEGIVIGLKDVSATFYIDPNSI